MSSSKSFEDKEHLGHDLGEISTEMKRQTRRLSNTLNQMEQRVQIYDALAHDPQYPLFVFLSEQGTHACDSCLTHHGTLLTAGELFQNLAMIPPLHPNCKCRLVAMDTRMATQYNQNKEAFLAALERAVRGNATVLRLDHSAATRGINSTTLVPLQLREIPVVLETRQDGPSWQERLRLWSNGWLSSAQEKLDRWAEKLLADAVEMIDAFMEHGQQTLQRAMDTDNLMAIILFGDFLLGTAPSALVEGTIERWERYQEQPSIFNLLNNLTVGLGDMSNGALAPDDPWSFQHFLDMTGVLTVIIGVAQGVRGSLDVNGTLGEAERAAYRGTSNVLDDAAQAVAQQMDDLVDDAAREAGTVIKTTPADDLNRNVLIRNPTYDPPYWQGTTVYDIRLPKDTVFMRVYGETSEMAGRWMMRADDILGLSAEEIQHKFSLPQKPTHFCNATVPAGTVMQVSGAGAALGGTGGGVQFFTLTYLDRWFYNAQKLP